MVSLRKTATIVVIAVLGVVFMAPSAFAQVAGGIGGRPAHPDPDNPRTQSIFIFTANKGEAKRDAVKVVNGSAEEQTVKLYAVDGVVTNTGAYTCEQESEERDGMGGWINLSRDSVTLAPGKSENIDFTLSMPEAADVGEHNGCIVFQVEGDEGEASGNVRIRTRQAIRVVATVPGDLHREVTIGDFTYGSENQKQTYELTLRNKGNVSADVDANVYMKTLAGKTVYENGGGYPVLAGQKLELTFTSEDRPFFGGWYYVSAAVSYDKRAGEFGMGDNANTVSQTTDRELIFVAPTVMGGILLLTIGLVLAGLTVWLVQRIRMHRDALKSWDTYTVKQGDSLQSIADKRGIGWRQLARVNRLAAPYSLNAGDKILLPAVEKKTIDKEV